MLIYERQITHLALTFKIMSKYIGMSASVEQKPGSA